MSRVGFECAHCRHRISVTAEWAGKAVRCPKCKVVVIAPTASSHGHRPTASPAPPDVSKSTRLIPEADSIFSDPDDGDGDSLFSGASDVRKPVLPPDASQPTLRVPGLPVSPPRPGTGAKTAGDGSRSMPTVIVPAEVTTNPFRRMVDEVMTEELRPFDDEPDEREDSAPAASGWMKWALVGVSVYAALATAAAVWGWTRDPAGKPAVVAPKRLQP